jgi:uncharacterized protein (TIGR03437 family)
VLLKIAPSGELVYGTYLGGERSLSGGLAVDSRGAATVCGYTVDPYLPASPNAFQRSFQDQVDAFVTRVSPDGSRFEALTYLGGAGADYCMDLKLNATGNVYVFGDTGSLTFPVTQGAYQTRVKGMHNLFVAELDHDLSRLVWSTYIGSNGIDFAQSIALNADGALLLAGTTQSPDFPVTAGTTPPYLNPGPFDYARYGMIQRPFIVTLDPPGSRLRSAYVFPFSGGWLGTADQTSPFYGVAWAHVDMIAQNATLNAAGLDGFLDLMPQFSYRILVRVDSSTIRPTYLGPLRDLEDFNPIPTGVATDAAGNPVIAGRGLGSYNLPGVPVRQLSEAAPYEKGLVVFNLDFSSEKRPLVTQVVNPASLVASPTAPGQVMQICGLGLGSMETTQVLIDGVPAPIISAASDLIHAVAPASFVNGDSFNLVVKRDGVPSDARTVPAAAVNPALFTVANTGSGQASATNEDGALNSPAQPALKGRRLRLLATGLGAAEGAGQPIAAITANVNGVAADVLAVMPATGYPDGYIAIDISVPLGAPAGDFIPVAITVKGMTSQAGVTVALR